MSLQPDGLGAGRPDGITDAHLVYLDVLRESGVTNMFGAASYVAEHFSIPTAKARVILSYWMKSFGAAER
jgi:hypothetical protein